MTETKSVSRAEIEAALVELDEPLTSEVFNSWSFEPLLEYIEQSLKSGKRGLATLAENGLIEAAVGRLPKKPLEAFTCVRAFGAKLSRILDKVERNPQTADVERIRFVLRRWRRFAPA